MQKFTVRVSGTPNVEVCGKQSSNVAVQPTGQVDMNVNAFGAVGGQALTTSLFDAGESIDAYNTVFLSDSGEWVKADATTEATSKGLLAMALEAKTVGQKIKVLMPGFFVTNPAWTWPVPRQTLYISTTSGELTINPPTNSDEVVRVAGWVVSETKIFFSPSQDYITLN